MTLTGARTGGVSGTLAGARRHPARRVLGRLGWGVGDQAVSSLGSFALSLYVAHTFGAAGFGAFTLAFVTASVVLNASRGTATDPLLVRHSGPADAAWRRAAGAATGTAVVVGLVCGTICTAVGLVIPGQAGPAFVAMGLALPGVMLLDAWRFAFFSVGRGRAAFAIDLVWTIALVAVLAALHAVGAAGVDRSLLAWGVTAALAGGIGAVRAGVRPRLGDTLGWLRRHRDLAGRYLAENVTFAGASQLRAVVLGGAVGLAAVGQLRASEMLMGPFVVILMGISQVAVPEAARVLRQRPARLHRFCLVLGSAQAVAAATWGLAMLVALPLGLGEILLHELWPPAAALLPAVLVTVVASCYTTAAQSGLRALGAARRSLRSQLYASAGFLVGGGGGGLVAGTAGAAWGSAVATSAAALLWWHQLRAGLRQHATTEPRRPAMTAQPTTDPSVGPVVDPDPGHHGEADRPPRMSIGLPVYNGERFLAAAVEALLAQTYTDFELVISDNASTDATEAIARSFLRDPRVRYLRQEHNIGSAANHNAVVEAARGELFKWASDDDLYAPDLLHRCVEALDARPEVVLAHCATAFIDESGEITNVETYPLRTDVGDVVTRLRSLLYTQGGDDIYGVIRTSTMRAVAPHGSYHNADRVIVAELALHGRFHQVGEALYFRRDHPGRCERAAAGLRPRCVRLDPARADRWRHPALRLGGEYLAGYVQAILRAPLAPADKARCLSTLAVWVLRHADPLRRRHLLNSPDPAVRAVGARSWVARLGGSE